MKKIIAGFSEFVLQVLGAEGYQTMIEIEMHWTSDNDVVCTSDAHAPAHHWSYVSIHFSHIHSVDFCVNLGVDCTAQNSRKLI